MEKEIIVLMSAGAYDWEPSGYFDNEEDLHSVSTISGSETYITISFNSYWTVNNSLFNRTCDYSHILPIIVAVLIGVEPIFVITSLLSDIKYTSVMCASTV